MSSNGYAILGLGRPRSRWFGDVASWTNSGALGASFEKCLSVGEVRSRLASLQRWSALIIEADLVSHAGDVIAIALANDVAVFSVGLSANSHLPITARLDANFTRDQLAQALATHVRLHASELEDDVISLVERATAWRGMLVSVCGAGGVGSSTIAMALAQHLGASAVDPTSVCLVDMTRNSELAMLHNIVGAQSSIEDLIERNKMREANPDDVYATATLLNARGYCLIPGVQKLSAWTALPTTAICRSLEALRHSFLNAVIDVTADFESQQECGSFDVEERNAFARSATSSADLVVVVGLPGVKGLHSMWQVINALLAHDIDAQRIVPLINRAPKSPIARRDIGLALRAFTPAGVQLAAPVFVSEARIESSLMDATPLQKKFVQQSANALSRLGQLAPQLEENELAAIVPGSLGIIDESATA